MKFSISWLKTYLDYDENIDVLIDYLNDLGLEVEGVDDPTKIYSSFIVGKIEHVEKHPNADKLKVCKVFLGKDTKNIVCGANNVKNGMGVVVALPGTFIPGLGNKISVGKIRGVESFGMMCSELELNLSDEHDGIISLKNPNVGGNFSDWLRLNEPDKIDPVIEIAITPNRPDALGVYGIARDLHTKGLGKLIERRIKVISSSTKSLINVSLDSSVSSKDCPYFVGRYIKGINNNDSPDWLKNRIKKIGLRPISGLVDLTNFLTFDSARPLHVFDADILEGDLIVRKAVNGEELKALDGNIYKLDETMTVIADTKGVQAIGGIIGGEKSGCSENTKNIFIESAYFDPISTAKTGRKLGLITDARYRFERGIDPSFTESGLDYYTQFALNLFGGEPSNLVIAGRNPYKPKTFEMSFDKVEKVTGIKIKVQEQVDILVKLGFLVEKQKQKLLVNEPSWRPDITSEIDLVEEIIRVTSLNKLISTPLPRKDVGVSNCNLNKLQKNVSKIRRFLASNGLKEIINYSFIDKKSAEIFCEDNNLVMLSNSISSEMTHLRPSLIPGLLESIKKNHAQGLNDFAIFEIGQIFYGSEPGQEKLELTGVFTGYNNDRNAFQNRILFDIYDAKFCIEESLQTIGINPDSLFLDREVPDYFHPNKSAFIKLGKFKKIGLFGELNPKFTNKYGFKNSPIVFSIFLEEIIEKKDKLKNVKFENSPYPFVIRDFAFVVDEKIEVKNIIKAISKINRELIIGIKLFDVFEGKNAHEQIGNNKKSLGFEVIMQSKDRTLQESEIEDLSQKIILNVTEVTGGSLR
ncbi:MAG: phenylalanine--tRNA ligase subunit beta [Paracoccaceae bacterium]